MKPEILLKAYVLYQSEEAFRELVAGSLNEIYCIALRIIPGAPHLVEEAVMRVYCELARQAPRLGEEVDLSCWFREQTCKMAVRVLREEHRPVDRALKKEKHACFDSNAVEPAPPGLALRVCSGVLLSPRPKGLRLCWPLIVGPGSSRRARITATVAGVLVILTVIWNRPFHRSNPIIRSPDLQMTPASFAQLANPEEGVVSPEPNGTANANAQNNAKQQ